MQLTQFTDYALRTLIYVSVKNDTCTIAEISDVYGISKNHLVKVIHKLGQLGYLKTVRGNKGGIQLHHLPSEINIGDLVKKMEPNFHIVECFDKANNQCVISPACKLRKILYEANQGFINTLCQYTLADLITNKAGLEKLFKI